MMNGEVLKISLKNQQRLWEKCPYCGEKPQEIEWGDGYVFVKCVTCENDVNKKDKTSCVAYINEENTLVSALGILRKTWNRMCKENANEEEE